LPDDSEATFHTSIPPRKPPIIAEGLRVLLDEPTQCVRVIRSSNGIYEAALKGVSWQPSVYGGSIHTADDERETISVGGARKINVRVRCADPRNPPASLLDVAREEALERLKAAVVKRKLCSAAGVKSCREMTPRLVVPSVFSERAFS